MKAKKWLVIGGLVLLAAGSVVFVAKGWKKSVNPVGQAELALQDNRPDDAIQFIEKASAEVRETYAGQFVLGRAYEAKANYEKAASCLNEALKYDPKKADPYVELAKIQAVQAASPKPETDVNAVNAEGLKYCGRALALDPTSANAYALQAGFQETRGDIDDALASLKRASEQEPQSSGRVLALAQFYARQGNMSMAAKTADDAVAAAKKDKNTRTEIEALMLKAGILSATDRDSAKGIMKALVDRSDVPVDQKGMILLQLVDAALGEPKRDRDEISQYMEQLKQFPQLKNEAAYRWARLAKMDGDWVKVGDLLAPLENTNALAVLNLLAESEVHLGKLEQAITHYRMILNQARDQGTVGAPYALSAHSAIAPLLLNRGQVDEALTHCEAVLREAPSDTGMLRLKARIHRLAGPHYNPMLVESIYRKVEAYEGDSIVLEMARAEFANEQGQFEQAIQYATAAQNRQGEVTDAQAKREVSASIPALFAAIYRRQAAKVGEKTDEGVRLLGTEAGYWQTAMSRAEDGTSYAVELARTYLALGKKAEAIGVLEAFRQGHPKAGMAYGLLSMIYERDKDYSRSIAVMEQAKANGADGMDPSWIGRAYFISGNYKKAIESWRFILSSSESARGNVSMALGLAVALAMDNQAAEATNQVESALQNIPPGINSALLAACVSIQCGNPAKAKEFLGRVSFASSREKAAYLEFVDACSRAGDAGRRAAAVISTGYIHQFFGDPDTAAVTVQQTVAALPDSIVPYLLSSRMLVQNGKGKAALDVFDGIFKKFPTEGFPHLNYAVLGIQLGLLDVSAARDQLELAAALDPELVDAHLLLADVRLWGEASSPVEMEKVVAHALAAEKLRSDPASTLAVANAETQLARVCGQQASTERDLSAQEAWGQKAQRALAEADRRIDLLRREPNPALVVTKTIIRYDLQHGDFAAAAKLAGECLKAPERTDPEMFAYAVEAQKGRGDVRRANRYLDEMMRVYPGNPGALVQQAYLYQEERRFAEADAAFAAALKANPNNLNLLFEFIAFLSRRQDYGKAVAVCQTILKQPALIGDSDEVRQAQLAVILRLAGVLISAPAEKVEQRDSKLVDVAALLAPFVDSRTPNAAAISMLGRLREEQGRRDEALALYARCVPLVPKSVGPWQDMALLYVRSKDYDKAIETLEKAAAAVPAGNLPCSLYLTFLYLMRDKSGDADHAAGYLNRLLGFQSSMGEEASAELAEMRFVVLVAQRKYSDALSEIKGLKDQDPGIRQALSQLVAGCSASESRRHEWVTARARIALYRRALNLADAIGACQGALQVFPRNASLLERLAGLQLANGQRAEFADTLELLIRSVESDASVRSVMQPEYYQRLYRDVIETRRGLGSGVSDAAKWRSGLVALCSQALERWPNMAEFHGDLAMIYLEDEASYPQAVEHFLEAIKMSAAAGESKNALLFRTQLAQAYMEHKDYAKALVIYREIEPAMGDDVSLLNNSAWLHAAYGSGDADMAKAIGLAERAKSIDPTDANLRDTLGWVYYKAGEYGAALNELDYAAKEIRDNPDILYHLGAVQLKLQRKEAGIGNLKKAMKLFEQRVPFDGVEGCRKLLAQFGQP